MHGNQAGSTTADSSALSAGLGIIGDEIMQNKLRHGWKITGPDDWQNQHEIPGVLALIHSEVSEALEAFRNDDRANFAEELADVMIRTIGLAHGMQIDLGAAILAKIEKNRTRPIKHGGKRV